MAPAILRLPSPTMIDAKLMQRFFPTIIGTELDLLVAIANAVARVPGATVLNICIAKSLSRFIPDVIEQEVRAGRALSIEPAGNELRLTRYLGYALEAAVIWARHVTPQRDRELFAWIEKCRAEPDDCDAHNMLRGLVGLIVACQMLLLDAFEMDTLQDVKKYLESGKITIMMRRTVCDVWHDRIFANPNESDGFENIVRAFGMDRDQFARYVNHTVDGIELDDDYPVDLRTTEVLAPPLSSMYDAE